MLNLADLEGGESFDPAWLGQADEVGQERIAEEELLLIKVHACMDMLVIHIFITPPHKTLPTGLQDLENGFRHSAWAQLIHAR